mgnify:CR=1 FL=1
MTEIPTLDLGPYFSGDTSARERLARDLRDVQESIGFYVVVNHGVPSEPIARAYAALKEFFELPLDAKLKGRVDDTGSHFTPYVVMQASPHCLPLYTLR